MDAPPTMHAKSTNIDQAFVTAFSTLLKAVIPENAFYFEIEEYEIPEPEPEIVPEVPVVSEEKVKEESAKAEEEEPKPEEDKPKPVEENPKEPEDKLIEEPADSGEKKPKKKKEKAPLKPEVPLSAEDLENVLSKLPESMQVALADSNEEGKYEFRGSGDGVAIPPTKGASVSRKVFPPPPPTEAELKAEKLAREQKEAQKAAIKSQTLAPVEAIKSPPAAPPSVASPIPGPSEEDDSKEKKKADKIAQAQAKEAQKAADKLAKEQAKEAEAAKKADAQAKKDAEKATKEAEKARLEAEALAAQEKAEREIWRVENYTPEGFLDSKIVKRIVITFNHPLAIKSGEEPEWVPKVTPALPEGNWIVSGEKENSLVFEPADPNADWPLSTAYTVKIVAGSLGRQNRPLANELSFTFTTPTAKLMATFPDRDAKDVSPSAPIVLVFDQPMDWKQLLSTNPKHKQLIIKHAHASTEVEMERCEDVERLKQLEQLHQADKNYTRLITGADDCHWIALLPKKPFPRGTAMTIHLESGLTSLAGAVKTRESVLNQNFTTRAAFHVTDARLLTQEEQLQITFTHPLCGPKEDLTAFAWRPDIVPAPPAGQWVLSDDKKRITYRTDSGIPFTPSTEYIITLKDGQAKSWYDQPLEKNDNLALWSTGEPLEQLASNKKTVPREPFWFSVVTKLNTLIKSFPDNGYLIPGNNIWLLETSQPVDHAELVKNIQFYVRKSGVVAALTSLVKKEKPHGVAQIVPWEDARRSQWHRHHVEDWDWYNLWLGPKNYVAVKCSLDFEPGTEVEFTIGPRLPSTLGPVPAVIEHKSTAEIPSGAWMTSPSFVHVHNRREEAKYCPVTQKQIDRVRSAIGGVLVDKVFASHNQSATDDFSPSHRSPSAVEPNKPREDLREQVQTAVDLWKTRLTNAQSSYAQAVQNHQNALQQKQTQQQAHQQAVAAYNVALAQALASGSPLPAPVPPYIPTYVSPSPPTRPDILLEGDLPDPTVDELITPYQAVHMLRVNFNALITLRCDADLGWTPIITPEPPAGKWMLGSDKTSYFYKPHGSWNMSTVYTVSLPPNARSYWGVPFELAKLATDTVSTPVVNVGEIWWPSGSSMEQPIMPTFVIAFTQQVTPSDVIKFVHFSTSSVMGVDLKKPERIDAVLVKESHWKKNDLIVQQVGFYAPGKFIVVQPASALKYRASVTLQIGPKYPSAEGPRKETGTKTQLFTTVPTFEVVSFAPGSSTPLTSQDVLYMRFNQPLLKLEQNLIDAEYKLPWTPTIKPKHPGTWTLQRTSTGRLVPNALKFTPSEPWLRATKYTVSLPQGTASLVGETLQSDWQVSVSTPAVELVRVWPSDNGIVGRKPLFYLEFDALVNENSVLGSAIFHSKTQTDSNGARQLTLAVVPSSDALRNPTIAKMAAQCSSIVSTPVSSKEGADDDKTTPASPKSKKSKKPNSDASNSTPQSAATSSARRWVVLTPTKPLMFHDTVSMTLMNLASAEGDLVNNVSYSLKFHVVGPLECHLISPIAWRQELPSSEMKFAVQFNQPIVETPDSTHVSFHTKTIPDYPTLPVAAESDSVAASSSSTSVKDGKKSKSSSASVATFSYPVFEAMETEKKTKIEKMPTLEWIIEDDGKRLVTTVPVKMNPSSLYRLSVPRPCTSLYGEELPEAQVYMLRTPTNRIAECWPRPGGIVRETSSSPAVLIRFAQPVNPAEVLPHLHFYVKKEKSKGLLSGIFGRSKKDDKPFCTAVPMSVDELGQGDAKIQQLITEWSKLCKAQEDAAAVAAAAKAASATDDIIRSASAATVKGTHNLVGDVLQEAAESTTSGKKKSSKKREQAEPATNDAKASSSSSDFVSPYSTSHWILIRPERPLPHSQRVNLVVGPELPSLLGPQRSAERKMKLLFSTAPPLEVGGYFNEYEGTVLFRFNQNMFHDGVKLIDAKDLKWKPILNVDLPLSSYPTWWVINATTLKFWVRHWPNSTKYVFMLPPNDAMSMYGEKLADRWTLEFQKPTASIVGKLPTHYTTTTDPVFALKFDQFVDPKEIAAHCYIYVKGQKQAYTTMEPVRFADALATCKSNRLYGESSAILKPEDMFRFREGAAGKIVWMRPKAPLPHGVKFRLQAGPGLPSLEGPLTDPKPVKYSHHTTEAFKIVSSKTLTYNRLMPIYITFSNNFAEGLTLNDPAIRSRLLGAITVTPSVPVEKVLADWNGLRVWIHADALTSAKTYSITVADWVTDLYGQGLNEEIEDPVENLAARTVTVKVEPVEFTHELVADMGSFVGGDMMITYDPMMLHHGQAAGHTPSFRIQNINYEELRVMLFKLDVENDLSKWVKLRGSATHKEPLPQGMGRLISDKIIKIKDYSDPKQYGTQSTVDIDLGPALESAEDLVGHIGLVVMPTQAAHNPNSSTIPAVRAWIQCTKLGVEVFPSAQGLFAWVYDMVDSTPIKAARVRTIPDCELSKDALKTYIELKEGSTDKNGWTTLAGTECTHVGRHLIAVKGTDSCILPNVKAFAPLRHLCHRMFYQIWNDRGMYRPKETVEIKGYLREFSITPAGVPTYSVPLLAEGADAEEDVKNLKWELLDPTGSKVTDGSFVLDPTFGTFHITVLLPENINLGSCSVRFTGLGPYEGKTDATKARLSNRLSLDATHTFVVQEFRRPDFVAKSEILDQRSTYLYGEDALVKVEASYFAGGALPDCDVTWKVTSSQAAGFSSPGWLGYLFATAKDHLELANSERIKRSIYDYTKNFTALTDDKGRHAVRILFKGTPTVCQPVNVVVDIEVLDLNKQALTSQQKLLIHPSRVYLGIKCVDGNQLMGDLSSPGGPDKKPLSIMLIAADIDGKLIPDLPIQVKVCKVLSANTSKLQNVLETRFVASRSGVPAVFEFNRLQFVTSPFIENYAIVVTMTDPATSRMQEVVTLIKDPVAVQANSPFAVATTTTVAPSTAPVIISSRPMPNAGIRAYTQEYEYFNMADKTTTLQRANFTPLPVDSLTLEASQPKYNIGEVARLTVSTGMPIPAEAVVIIRGNLGNTILATRTISLKDETSLVEFTITEELAPWADVHISAVSTVVREGQEAVEASSDLFKRLAQAEGHIRLQVNSNHRELQVVVLPDDPNAAPGAEAEITVKVSDWKQNAVTKAEVALVVVDESVLSMTHYEIPSAFKHFYDPEPMKAFIPEIGKFSIRNKVQLKDIKAVLEDADKRKKAKIEEINDENLGELAAASEESEEAGNLDAPVSIEEEKLSLADDQHNEAEDRPSPSSDYDDEEPPAFDEQVLASYDEVERASSHGFGGLSRLAKPARKQSHSGNKDKISKDSINEMALSGRAGGPPPPPPAAFASSPRMNYASSPPPPPAPGGGPAPPMLFSESSLSYASLASPSSSSIAPILADFSAKRMRRSSFGSDASSEEDEDDADDWDDDAIPTVQSEQLQQSGLMLDRDMEKSSKPKPKPSASNSRNMVQKEMKREMEKEEDVKRKSKKKADMSFARKKMAAPAKSRKESKSAESLHMRSDDMDMDFASAELEDAIEMNEDEVEGGMIMEAEEAEVEEEIEELFLRSNFNPLAHFSDAVLVNDEGQAKIIVKLPDNLTRYRIWAIAVSAKNSMFGMGESLITASLPLQVRITPPRFLNYGDDAELPIVIQNLRDKPIEVKIGVRAIRAILGVARTSAGEESSTTSSDKYDAFLSSDLTTSGFLAEVPANGRRLIAVPIKATKAGTCKFQVSVLQGLFGDAQEVSVSVLAPPTTNSFSFSGSLAGGKLPSAICTDLRVPADALPEFGSLEVALSTTKLQSLSEAAMYLNNIPYEYTEQRASRVMALASLAPLIEALAGSSKKGRYPDSYRIKSTIASDMLYFKNYQLSDGSYRMWGANVHSMANPPPPPPGSSASTNPVAVAGLANAWLTAQVAQAVAAARAGGFNTHEPLLTLFSKSWTQKLEAALVTLCTKALHAKDSDFAPWAAAKCYTIYAYAKLSKDPKKAAKYAETFYNTTSPQTLSIESIAFLLSVFAEAKHDLASQLVNYLETAVVTYDLETRVSYPDIYTDSSRYELFHSRNRTDAVLLESIVSAKPDSKLVGHLFRGLMRSRVDNRWTNTQDNAFCVVAIYKYFQVYEAVVPDLKARVWLDKDMCVQEAFVGRTTDTRITEIPMSYVLQNPELVKPDDSSASTAASADGSKKKKKKQGDDNTASSSSTTTISAASAVVIEEGDDDTLAGSSAPGDDTDEADLEDPRTKGDENEPLQGKGLIIHKSGKGRLYYSLKINYSPKTLQVPAADFGFQVSRTYASPTYIADLASATDLLYLREAATWRVKKGTKVRVELKVVVFFPTTFVALVDNLPAGFEPIAVDEHPTREKVLPPRISNDMVDADVPADVPEDPKSWWSHINLRDSRVEVLSDKLQPGTYHFAYVARATMAGHFLVPSSRVEELYQPSVKGNTESTRMEIF